MQEDSRGVSQDFEREAEYHADHEAPCFVVDAETDLGSYDDAEDDGECEVAAVRRSVGKGRLGEAAGVEGTVLVLDLQVAASVRINCHLGVVLVGLLSCFQRWPASDKFYDVAERHQASVTRKRRAVAGTVVQGRCAGKKKREKLC